MKLSARDTKYRNLRVIRENIDLEIVSAAEGFTNPTLGQSQDVRPWIADPENVDWRIRKNLARFARLLPKPDPYREPVSVLDVGCYGGYAFDWLKKRRGTSAVLNYLGVDIEPGFVAEAERAHRGTVARFTVGNALDLNSHFFEKHVAFDAALCLRLVIHLPFLDRVLAGLMRGAPVALVGLRVAPEDSAVERLDEVSGKRHFYRWFSLATIEKAVPVGCEWKIYRDGSYDSLVIRRGP